MKLSEIVGQFLDLYDYGEAEYSKAYRIGIRGWRNLQIDVTGRVERVKVPVECDMTVCFPDECISVKGVHVSKNGKLMSLTENPGLSGLWGDCDEDEDRSNTYSDSLWENSRNVSLLTWGGSLGVGSENVLGEYKIDNEQRRVILNPEFPYSEVVLECILYSKVDGDYDVHEYASEAVLSYINWQWLLGKKGVSVYEKTVARREFYNQKRLAKLRIKQPLKQVLGQVTRQRTMGGVRS